MVEHRGLVNLALVQIQSFTVNHNSHVLQFASFSFDACISEILMTFGSGATLYLAPKDALLPGQPLIERLQKDEITHVTLPPSALAVLPKESLPNLQTLIVAGEACSLDLVKKWSVGRKFFNAYGPTEASVCASIGECHQDDLKVTIGKAIANVQIYILDAFLQPVPVGVSGELYIGGVGVARGYLNRPELTAERFIPNPFDPLDSPLTHLFKGGDESYKTFKKQGEQLSKLYKTGDLARYLPNGNIEYLGRIDNQVKIHGFRIELGEIETVLTNYSEIREAIVTIREDVPGNKSLVAYLVPQNHQLAARDVRNFLSQKLPNYMIPNAFVILNEFPLTPNGKINRLGLPAANISQQNFGVEFVAPRTPTERELVTIWTEVLQLTKIGIYDNFFEMGGHSLLATQLISRLKETFEIEFPFRYLFENPTISQLAEKLVNQQIEQVKGDELAQILGEIDELSEDEATQQLVL